MPTLSKFTITVSSYGVEWQFSGPTKRDYAAGYLERTKAVPAITQLLKDSQYKNQPGEIAPTFEMFAKKILKD